MRDSLTRWERLKPQYVRPLFMRALAALLMLVIISPTVIAISDGQDIKIDLEIYGEDILPTYSESVQAAFARVENLNQYSQDELEITKEWLVVTQVPEKKQVWTIPSPQFIEKVSLLPNSYIWHFNKPLEAIPKLQEALELGQIESFSPLVVSQTLQTRDNPNDPEFASQWHLENTGQTGGLSGEDINATDIWDNYRGQEVVISVVDDGLDHSHVDISPHYNSTFSYDWCNNDPDPTPNSWDEHGTAVAGVAAAVGNNSLYVSGAAWEATIAGSTLIACGTSDSVEADALSFYQNDIDIYTNSWGPSDNGQVLEAPGPLTLAAFESDAYFGRQGLGNTITWAAGNGLTGNDNANYDGYANSRFTIAVTAIDHNGEQSWYAEPGANILVAAHSEGDGEGITTTDITGSGGYNGSGNVTHNFGGTSSATPLAAGVIALMYDANENLSWRDVQEILVQSSRKNNPSDSSWETNGAGYEVSHKYGFGAVDAGAAVTLAENWTSLVTEVNQTYGPYSVNLEIPDLGSSNWSEFTLNMTQTLQIESVDVIVDIDHSSRGDLEIILESPDGTVSWLAEQHSDNGNNYNDWLFNTVHHWGEASLGEWVLKIRDASSGDNGTLNYWQIIFHGVDEDFDHDDDGLSDYNESKVWGTNPFLADTDGDGLDDYEEIMIYFTDPLISDSDFDGLTDGIEVNVVGSDPWNEDSDSDGLTDGVEVNVWGSDPLVYDPDADNDLFYHFQDCNDNNPIVNPGAYEALDGIDNNCDLIIDEGYNFTDRDNDGLKDWPEFHIHGTEYLDDDTDDDGLTDGDEVLVHGSNPLIYDVDADFDGYQWFLDCDDNDEYRNPSLPELLDGIDNDCDLIIDQDLWILDTDFDGLDDYNEYHNISTNPYDGDTDNDGLPDGYELEISSNPLVFDPDNDGDGVYWFNDCDDDDEEKKPFGTEELDGKDNDCDEIIDEDFYEIDTDQDGLSDYEEYHNYSTNPYNIDSDEDGLEDGFEIKTSKSNPLVYDFDRDEDGFFAFEDCQDLDATINPDVQEIWNGLDDDCNNIVDDEDKLNRKSSISQIISSGFWDSVNRSFSINLDGIPNEVDEVIVWEMEGVNLSDNVTNDGMRLHIQIIDCENRNWELAKILCREGDGKRQINATIIDSGIETKFQWEIDVEVYVEPPTLIDSLLSFFGSTIGIICILILILTIVGGIAYGAHRINLNQRVTDAYSEFQIDHRPRGESPEHRSVELPSAPDLSYLSQYQNEKEEPLLVNATVVTESIESEVPLLVTATVVSKSLEEE